MTPAWSPSELARRAAVEAGETVLADFRCDHALVAWAEATGLLVKIDRRSRWGNPFRIGRDGDRDRVCDLHAAGLRKAPPSGEDLEELRGRVLGCWCFPLRCHGEALLALLRRAP